MRLLPLALVGVGGAAGSIARYLVGQLVAARFGTAWPWGTFLINVSGCFVIGFFITYASGRVVMNDAWRYLVPIGFVGAYTTFSTYQWETLKLIEQGQWGRALVYVLGSTVAGFLAVWAAAMAARRV